MEEFTGKSNTSGSYEIYSYRKASFGIRMAPTGTTLSGGEVALNTYVGMVYPKSDLFERMVTMTCRYYLCRERYFLFLFALDLT